MSEYNTIVGISALFLLAAGMAGGFLPQYIRLSDRGLHRFLALGTGMLLGTIFYHMLPEALEGQSSATFVIIGLLGVFVVERIFFAETGHSHLPPPSIPLAESHNHDSSHHHHDDDELIEPLPTARGAHELIGVTAFAGLSVHALMVGLGLSAQLVDTTTAVPLLTSLLVHKLSEAFSLSTIFLLAGYPRKRALIMLGIFACIEPFGQLIGAAAIDLLPHGWESGASGLAAGTFLYVALCDLLPEVFHRRDGRWGSLAALVIGVVAIALLMAGGHGHAH